MIDIKSNKKEDCMKLKFVTKKATVVILISSILIIIFSFVLINNTGFCTFIENIYATMNFNKSNNLEKVKINDMKQIVAYVNDSPIYEAEVVNRKKRIQIDYEESSSSDQINRGILDLKEKNTKKTDEETIRDLAKQRLMILEAKKQGITVSDDEVRIDQKKEKDRRTQLASNGDKAIINSNKKFIELYKILGVTEEEYYNTYDFISHKDLMISIKFTTQFSKNYTEQVKQSGEKVDINAYANYLNDLLNKSDFRFVK